MNIRQLPHVLFNEFERKAKNSNLYLRVRSHPPHSVSLELYATKKDAEREQPRLNIYTGESSLVGDDAGFYEDVAYLHNHSRWADRLDLPEGLELSCQIILQAIVLINALEFVFDKKYDYDSKGEKIIVP